VKPSKVLLWVVSWWFPTDSNQDFTSLWLSCLWFRFQETYL